MIYLSIIGEVHAPPVITVEGLHPAIGTQTSWNGVALVQLLPPIASQFWHGCGLFFLRDLLRSTDRSYPAIRDFWCDNEVEEYKVAMLSSLTVCNPGTG